MADFMKTMEGMFCLFLLRMLASSVLLCLGVQLFDFKKLAPFFGLKRVISVFIILFGIRLFLVALHNF